MKKKLLSAFFMLFLPLAIFAQFEESQISGKEFEKLKVSLGGDFAMQFQSLSHHADSALIPLGKGFNLPTANMTINADLAPGIRLNLTTYLSSRHHNDTWVKGGYIIIDKLPFIKSERLDKIMDYITLKAGDMEVDYGDAHFRRTDNGKATVNPFVGNYIVDAFSTQIAAELLFRKDGLLVMGALSNGVLNPTLTSYNANTNVYTANNTLKKLAFYWKLGYDKQFTDDFRLRLTLSGYHQPSSYSGSLYNSDRAGSRYYLVMNRITNSANDVDITKNQTSGSWSPGTTNKDNSIMVNLFSKMKGFELFGTYENFKGTLLSGTSSGFNQYAIEGLYRFGNSEQFYGGVRYNYVDNNRNQSISRYQIAAGWYIIPAILVKAEYVNQDYKNFISTYGSDAGFKGVMFEAAVSF